MKALLVCAAPSAGYEDLVAVLAADSDVVIAVDGGALLCERAGIVPHVVVGDFDSLGEQGLQGLRNSGIELIEFSTEKDSSDLDLALGEARSRGVSEVVVCAAFSGRLDHTLAAVGSVSAAADMRPIIAEATQSGWLLSAGCRDTLEIGPSGTTWSLIPTTSTAVVSAAGMRWPLDRERLLPLSSRGLSNVVTDVRGTLRVHEGSVLVMSPFLEEATSA